MNTPRTEPELFKQFMKPHAQRKRELEERDNAIRDELDRSYETNVPSDDPRIIALGDEQLRIDEELTQLSRLSRSASLASMPARYNQFFPQNTVEIHAYTGGDRAIITRIHEREATLMAAHPSDWIVVHDAPSEHHPAIAYACDLARILGIPQARIRESGIFTLDFRTYVRHENDMKSIADLLLDKALLRIDPLREFCADKRDRKSVV